MEAYKTLVSSLISGLLLFGGTVPTSFAAHYEIDKDHSSVSFKIRHLISKTQGNFTDFKGQFDYEPGKSEQWKAKTVIKTASINTSSKKRDDHLRTADFFDAKKYPEIKFESTEVSDVDGDEFDLKGNLTMHGVTKPVTLKAKFTGLGVDPWGNKKAGFTATTKVNRTDFGIVWNKVLDQSRKYNLVGDEVEISLEVEGNLKEAVEPVKKEKS